MRTRSSTSVPRASRSVRGSLHVCGGPTAVVQLASPLFSGGDVTFVAQTESRGLGNRLPSTEERMPFVIAAQVRPPEHVDLMMVGFGSQIKTPPQEQCHHEGCYDRRDRRLQETSMLRTSDPEGDFDELILQPQDFPSQRVPENGGSPRKRRSSEWKPLPYVRHWSTRCFLDELRRYSSRRYFGKDIIRPGHWLWIWGRSASG
jgi:hypothetical protein